MRRTMQTDLFIWHGYTDIWIDGAWRKATPAFNRELCERFGLHPLAFNGHDDSIYHPYDRAGNRHMEYVQYRGSFDDMPLARIVADFEQRLSTLDPSGRRHAQGRLPRRGRARGAAGHGHSEALTPPGGTARRARGKMNEPATSRRRHPERFRAAGRWAATTWR